MHKRPDPDSFEPWQDTRRDWLAGAACGLLALTSPGPTLAWVRAEATSNRPLPTHPSAWQASRRQLFGSPADLLLPRGTPAAIEAGVWQLLAGLNRRWNAWKPGSELRALNDALQAGRAATVSPGLKRLLQQCQQLESASQGLFNPAIGAWVAGWGFHADRLPDGAPPPSPARLAQWQAEAPTLAALQWQGDSVRSQQPGLRIDLGAIGKGVALDLALDQLARQGVCDVLLNLGGNLAASGLAARAVPGAGGTGGAAAGRAWHVGVRHPQRPGLAALLRTQGREAVVTSGVYERQRRLLDGQLAHHVLDPRLGRPSSGLASVTVVHASAALADAGATALLVAGWPGWQTLAARLGLDQVLVIADDGRQAATPAMATRLLPVPLALTTRG